MDCNRMYNVSREANALKEPKKTLKKRYKDIIKELGERKITLDDIAQGKKLPGFLQMLDKTGGTLDDMVVLQQYSKAIIDRDTRSAEFIRDTRGDKPSTSVEMDVKGGGLSEMSLEDLTELRDLLKEQKKEDK